MKSTRTFKLAVIGDGATGKTSAIHKQRTSEFEKRYIATMSVEIHQLKFHTNKGVIIFNCWDIAGQEKLGGLRNLFYAKSDAALVFFDFSSKLTFTNTLQWKSDFKNECKNVPVVLCGNKSDLVSKISPTDIKIAGWDGYCSLSAKTNSNYEEPFSQVIKLLMGSDTEIIH